MKLKIKLLTLIAFTLFAVSCDDDEDSTITPVAGTLTGGPFTFEVGDGTADNVSGISVSGAEGTNSRFIITNEASDILGLPETITDLEGVDFDGAGVGICYIWYIRYEDGLTGLEENSNVSDISGSFDISNSIEVNRIGGTNAGTISGGEDDTFTFYAGDGIADMVSGITVSDDVAGTISGWIVTDDENNILGLPGTLEALEGNDFDGAGVGVCLIWHIRYEEGLTGLALDNNVSDISGSFDISNAITVNRLAPPSAGTISGGPFVFNVGNEVADMVTDIMVSDDVNGTDSSWIITDEDGTILGMPGTLEDLLGVDFDGSGVGVCLIWYMRYEGELTGFEADSDVADITGIFDISNSIEVTREEFGTMSIELTGLEDLGDDFVYEGWVIVDGSPVSTGVFTVSDDGTPSETEFAVRQAYLDAATMYVLSIEPAVDTDPAPADTKILSGSFDDGSAAVSVTGIVGDFSNAAGSYFLRTPTDEADGMNNDNDENGVWFANPADGSASLVLPTLTAGWAYEGWVVDENGTPITTGTFTAFDVADDANPYSGTDASPGFPGEDFFMNAPDGVTFPLDVTGRTVVISVEPVPDNSDAPFALKPLLGTAGTETAPTTYDLDQNLDSLPTGTVSF